VHEGEATIAAEQEPIGDDRHWDGNGLASLFYPSDYAPLKRRVDVCLVGHAYAPPGAPARELVATLRVGDFTKSIRVMGDRVWTSSASGLVPGAPAPFSRVPLRYERAALSADNPVGFDPHTPPMLAAPALPNLEPMSSEGAACFGPVAPTWRARRKLLDEASMFWVFGITGPSRRALGAAPKGFDFSFFNAAPTDQQIDLLRAGTPVELEHLHPEFPRLSTRLPALRPQVFYARPGAERTEEVALRCDSLWIDTDRAIATLSFRGIAELRFGAREVEGAALVVAADAAGKRLRFERLRPALERAYPGALAYLPPSPIEGDPDDDPLARRHDAVKWPPPGTDSCADAGTDSVAVADTGTASVVPTDSASVSASVAASAPVAPPAPVAAPVAAPAPVTASAPVAASADEDDDEFDNLPTTVGVLPKKLTESAPQGSSQPRHESAEGAPEGISLPRYAAISVELTQKGVDRSAALARHGLSVAAWTAVNRHWQRAMGPAAGEEGKALSATFDEAYLGAMAELLGKTIGPAAYARVVVGLERREMNRVLAELEVQLGDLMRIKRVWERKVEKDAALAAEVNAAIRALREGRAG